MKKELYLPYFKDKKITVMGLGLLGRGVGDTAFLASSGADILVTDKKTKEELASSLEALTSFQNITYHLGEHTHAHFENTDFVLKAAGVPFDSEYLTHAKEKGVPVYMSAALLVKIIKEKLNNVTVIGVTGTRGKSTTTYLIHHLLKSAGKSVHLAGNIRGVANLPVLEAIEEGDYLVLELDSWQLQGFGDLELSPDIAVFTSFLDDHLNYYHGDKEHYFNDKAQIFLHQTKGQVLFASPQAHTEIAKRGYGDDAIVPTISVYESNLIGSHNDISISLAHAVAVKCGIDEHTISEAVRTFLPAEGRLEYMGIFNGIHVYNDNNSTTPDATIAAVTAIHTKYNKNPIVILGGGDKDLDLSLLEITITEKVKEAVYIEGTGTNKISLEKEYQFSSLAEALDKAFSLSAAGDVLLFSPGFTSFSHEFRNEYERNDMFVSLLQSYRS
jgi:UDP-N-acetylmuramoylalanine--D-glutamate ligase